MTLQDWILAAAQFGFVAAMAVSVESLEFRRTETSSARTRGRCAAQRQDRARLGEDCGVRP